jgi:CheY-like chemotaxis protein
LSRLRILIAEDLESDTELIWKELQRAGINCDAHRVDTGVDFRRELEEFKPHVILSDFTMPSFNGMDALEIARQGHPEIPFIFVSGTLGEEYAIRALKNGAKDYVLKGNLLRLPAAVERAMKEARERGVRQTVERDLRATEKMYRQLFLSHPHPTWVYEIASSRISMVNDAAITRYGFDREEFLAMTIDDLRGEPESPGLDKRFEKHRTKTGELLDVTVTYTDIELDDRVARIVVATLIA